MYNITVMDEYNLFRVLKMGTIQYRFLEVVERLASVSYLIQNSFRLLTAEPKTWSEPYLLEDSQSSNGGTNASGYTHSQDRDKRYIRTASFSALPIVKYPTTMLTGIMRLILFYACLVSPLTFLPSPLPPLCSPVFIFNLSFLGVPLGIL